MSIAITVVTTVTPDLVAAFERLLPQLSPAAPRLDARDLAEIVSSPGATVFIARDPADGSIVGTATLIGFRIPSGRRARIESLIVDQGARRRGVGQALCQAALVRAREMGADTVDLTSSHARQAANELYSRIGFERRASNVYRYAISRGRSDRLPARGEPENGR
jgi:ribosomal protein S18 acetylase RimI-like enzyme